MRRVLLGLSLCVLLAFPAGAHATSVVMFSEQGDYIGLGEQRLFDDQNSTFLISGDAEELYVGFRGGLFDEGFSVRVAAPPGEQLHEGFYGEARRPSVRSAGQAGLEIFGEGRGCEVDGSLEVKDIEVAPDGTVDRLWMLFKQRCDSDLESLFGEVRFGGPDTEPAVARPGAIRWPEVDLGAIGEPVPVAIRATGDAPVTVTEASIEGAAPDDFAVVQDECSGVEVDPGGFCDIWVAFAPAAAGTRSASLAVRGGDGLDLDVPLEGFAFGGTTMAWFDSDPDEPLGDGDAFLYDPSNARIWASGNEHKVYFWVGAFDGDHWRATFEAPDGGALKPGMYEGPIDVEHRGLACTSPARFEVSEAEFGPDGKVVNFGVGFEQHCARNGAALRGTLEFRAPKGSAQIPGQAENPPSRPPSRPAPRSGPPLTRENDLPVVPPTNAFFLRRVRLGRHGLSTHTIKVPGAGRLDIVAAAHGRTVAHARRSLSRAGVYTLRLRPKRSALALLKQRHRLRVQVRITFTPRGGHPRTKKIGLVLKS